MIQQEATTDAELVTACLGGDREAFAQIVERYQRLLCSIAYSATGDLAASEDLAQEAFVTAWQQLGKLREPDKLRSWLCTILRFTISRSRRSNRRDPSTIADPLHELEDQSTGEPSIPHETMKKEEEKLLWQALEGIPLRYRDPLILYYREEHSVRKVAQALQLTESGVKQRLTRGRKILKERMLSFVEGALRKSAPGPAFTAGVIASIATLGTPAKAAAAGVAGTAAGKAGMSVKLVAIATFIVSISGVISTWFGLKAGLDQSRTARERRNTIWLASLLFGSFVVLVGVMLGLRSTALGNIEYRTSITVFSQVFALGFAVGWSWMLFSLLKKSRRLRAEERQRLPEAFTDPRDKSGSAAGEYRSKWTLLGIPLFHFRFAAAELGSPPVIGWIAGGDRAIGILFAWGAYAVGTVSVGAVSVGIFTLGAVGIGVFTIGSIAFGVVALGAISFGYIAFGSLSALGWKAAAGGGFGVAKLFAAAPVAIAEQANNAASYEYFASPHTDLYILVFCIVATLMTLIPVILYARAVRKRLGGRSNSAD